MYGDWGKLGLPHMTRMTYNKMLMNAAKCLVFTVFTIKEFVVALEKD